MHAWDLGAAAAAMAELERRNSWISRSREAMDQAEIQAIRGTMIRQESIFKEQVRELHSLYQKQRNIVAEARKSTLPPPSLLPPPPTTTTAATSLLGTRDFLKLPPMKRRRTFDLEKLPEENDDDDGDDEYPQDQKVRPGSADVYGGEIRTSSEQRPRVVEMPLFPIPSRLARSELPPEKEKLPKYVGWSGNLGKLHQESYWFQEQHQQVVAPHWVSQNVGAQSQRFMPPSHFGSNDPWRNSTAGQHGACFGNSRLDYQQNGRHYSSAMNYPVVMNPVMSMHDLARSGLVANSWLQQLPGSYSYFAQLTHEKPAAAAIDDKRVYPELRNSWVAGSSTPAAALFSNKPPLPPSFSNHIKEISPAKLGGQQDSVFCREQQNPVGSGLRSAEGTSEPAKAPGECSLVRHSESTPGAGKGTGSDSAQPDNCCSSRKDSAGACPEALVVDDKKPDKEPLATTDCIGDAEMSISDTATILLSLAPAKKPSREASSVIEASLMSDLKLFKSVAIMLKESGAVKTTTKKLVARPSCRKQGEGGAAAAATGNAAAGVKAAEQKSLHTWMWGDVTRRKRMQRQRPQQVQV